MDNSVFKASSAASNSAELHFGRGAGGRRGEGAENMRAHGGVLHRVSGSSGGGGARNSTI